MKSPKSSGKQKRLLKSKSGWILLRRVHGDSMRPTLKQGTIIIALRSRGSPKPGHVVVITHDGIEKVKRVVHVDADGIRVVGDNRLASTDSRHFGSIAPSDVKARVIWPRTRKT